MPTLSEQMASAGYKPNMGSLSEQMANAGHLPLTSIPSPVASPSLWEKIKTGGQAIGEQMLAGGQKILSSITGGGEQIQKGINAQNPEDLLNIPAGIARGGAGAVVGAGQVIAAPITAAIKTTLNKLVEVHPELATAFTEDKINPRLRPLVDKIKQYPEQVGLIGDVFNAALTFLGAKGIDAVPQLKVPVSTAVRESVGALQTMGQPIYDTAGNLISKGKDAVSEVSSKVKGLIVPKTDAQVLSTPPEKVGDLTSEEQSFWYKKNAEAANAKIAEGRQLAEQVKNTQLENTNNQIRIMNQRLGQVTTETASSLKEPVRQMLRDAGNIYLKLSGEAADVSPALNKTISAENLTAKIDNEFQFDQPLAIELKNNLGLNPVDITKVNPIEKLTNQQILDKAREIMQTVSRTARAGNRTYSVNEYQALKQYRFLMETLSENGVDMRNANNFWKSWAPVRDRAVAEIKPFDEQTIKAPSITKTLNKAVSTSNTALKTSAQIDAQNFITELETRLKVPKGIISAESQDIASAIEKLKLSKDMTQKVFDKTIEKLNTEKQFLNELRTTNKFNDAQKAVTRKRVRTAIKYALIYLGLKEASHFIP